MSTIILNESYNVAHLQDMAQHFTVAIPVNCQAEELNAMVQQSAMIRDAAFKLLLGQISWMDYCDILQLCSYLDMDNHLCGIEDYLDEMGLI
jgi:hypothetical protein